MIANRRQSPRYNSPIVHALVNQLEQQKQTHDSKKLRQIKQQRKMHHSMSLSQSRRNQFQNRPLFNNKTKDGDLLEKKAKLIPYIFIPKYKNQTFIMPNRVFQKGRAGKRFAIKMKDTSIYSFKDEQNKSVQKIISKVQKQKTILSRQVEEYNRIVDIEDGRKKAEHNNWFLRTRKVFNYTKTGSQMFSQCQPMIGVKDTQNTLLRKTSLAKTFDFSNKWRPNSRAANVFDGSGTRSVFGHQPHISSVL